MGFLSKLFGGDAGSASGKAADEPASSPAEAAAGVRANAPAANEVAQQTPHAPVPAPAAKAPKGAREPEPAILREPVMTGEHRTAPGNDERPRPPRAPNLVETAKNPKAAARAQRPAEQKPLPPPAREPEAATAAPAVPRRAPEPPQRAARVENSIVTSAPVLAPEPQRPFTAPRPVPGAKHVRVERPATETAKVGEPPKPLAEPPKPPVEPARAASPPEPAVPPRAPMPSVTGEGGLLAAGRNRKDRSKSPGFYSNMAPAYGAQLVNPGASQSIKRTAIGLAPPPDAPAPDAVAKASPAGHNGAAAPSTAMTDGGAVAAPVGEDAAVPPVAAEGFTESDSAPPRDATDELEKEETAPGVGHTPSRHDPSVRNDIPERDLELLMQFVMDLGLGLASDVWIAPAREAVGRLKGAAAKLGRSALDKALAQLGVEMDAPNPLAEERRSRIAQQLVLVDLALPRPIDVSGQRLLRDRLVVQHLLAELGVHHPLIAQRLREDGTLTLERFSRLAAPELAEKASISAEQAEHALSVFREYLLERARRGPDAWLLGQVPLLQQRLAELEASAQEFESVADGDDARAKREARRKRQADIARVGLFLAEWGQAGILGEFERASVQGKIARLRRWLTELQAS
jgi:hypothetical protein